MAKRREIEGQLELFDNLNPLERTAQQEQPELQEKPRISIRRGEYTPTSYKGLKLAIIEWHRANGIPLPQGFENKNRRQLRGMYWGIYKRERRNY